MVAYRRGIAGKREIERLIAQNQLNVKGEGEVLSSADARQMMNEYGAALKNYSILGHELFGENTYSKHLEMEANKAAHTEQYPMRKRKKIDD